MGCRRAAFRVVPARWTPTQRLRQWSTRSLEATIGAKVGGLHHCDIIVAMATAEIDIS